MRTDFKKGFQEEKYLYIYLMRHGETHWNVEHRQQGSSDIPLNANGIKQAEAMAFVLQEIPFDRIYSSPLLRAKQTAEVIARNRDLPILIDNRLKEISFGDIEGVVRTDSEIAYTYFHHPEKYVPAKGGETYQQLDARCHDVIDTLIRPLEYQCGYLLICTHSAFINGILRIIMRRPLKEFWRDKPPQNCACTVIKCKKQELSVLPTIL